MQTDSYPYRKLESVLTSRQQVLRFVAKVRTDRRVQQAGIQAQREEVGMQHAGMQVPYGDKIK